jgi:hypothetical protein
VKTFPWDEGQNNKVNGNASMTEGNSISGSRLYKTRYSCRQNVENGCDRHSLSGSASVYCP